MPFDCSDKKIRDTWDARRSKNLANIPSPFRALLVGPPGVGKSTLVKNLLIHQRPRFDELIIIHLDHRDDGSGSAEYADCDPTHQLAEIPSLDEWDQLFSGDDPDRPTRRLVVLDDLEFERADKSRLQNLGTLFRYVSSHRGMSIALCHQSFFHVPTIVKQTSSVFILWRPRATSEYALLDNRCGLPRGTLHMLFNEIATGEQDSIMVDHSPNTPAPLRLNIWQPITLD